MENIMEATAIPRDLSHIREAIFSVFKPLEASPRITVDEYINPTTIYITHKNAHVPDYKLVWSEYGDDNYLYRVYISIYNAAQGEKIEGTHSTATIRSVSDAYGLASHIVWNDKHRPRM
jgi:hypothetical protein